MTTNPELLHQIFCRDVIKTEIGGAYNYQGIIARIPWSFVSDNLGRPLPLIYAFAIRDLPVGSHRFWLIANSPSGQVIETPPQSLMVEEASQIHYGQIYFGFIPVEQGDFVFKLLINGNPIATTVLPISD